MKFIYALLLVLFMPLSSFAEVVHLNCEFKENKFDLIVNFLDDGATISVNGTPYTFRQEYDVRASFYNPNPWMRLEVGNRSYGPYAFATMLKLDGDTVPFYMTCDEVQ